LCNQEREHADNSKALKGYENGRHCFNPVTSNRDIYQDEFSRIFIPVILLDSSSPQDGATLVGRNGELV
jgi:hypothetical protein